MRLFIRRISLCALCLTATAAQAGNDGSCSYTITNCLTSSIMTEHSEISVFVYDGNDAVHMADNESHYLSANEVQKLSCDYSDCDTWVEGYVDHKWREHRKNDSCSDLWIIQDGSNDFSITTSSGC
ncbi:hypothetical protein [Endothiovibrio diazotrophicus]